MPNDLTEQFAVCFKTIALKMLGRDEEAAQEFARAVEKASIPSEAAEVWHRTAACLHSFNRHEEALYAFQKAVEADGSDAKNRILLGYFYFTMGDRAAARAAFKQAAALDSANEHAPYFIEFVEHCSESPGTSRAPVRAIEKIVAFLYDAIWFKEAIRLCDVILSVVPDHVEALRMKGFGLCRSRRPEEGLKILDAALTLAPERTDILKEKGIQLHCSGKHEEALTCFDKMIVIDPANASPWVWKGYCLDRLGKHEEALAALAKGVELNPRHRYAWERRFYMLTSLDRYAEAVEVLSQAHQIHPENISWEWRELFALRLVFLNGNDKELAIYDKFLKLFPFHDHVLGLKGCALARRGWHEDALKVFDTVLDLAPEDKETRLDKAGSLRALKRYDEALEIYDRLINEDPDRISLWVEAGHTLYQCGRFAEAVPAYDTALRLKQLKPDEYIDSSVAAKKAYAEWRAAKPPYEEIIAALDEEIESDPYNMVAMVYKIDHLIALGRYDEAVKVAERLVELHPQDSYAWDTLRYARRRVVRYHE